MSEYVPMAGPLPGERYMPSNGTEGDCFQDRWCSECARDKEMNGTCYEEGRDADDDDYCPILNASYRDEAAEWRVMPNGDHVCLGFEPICEGAAPARCEHTREMFACSEETQRSSHADESNERNDSSGERA